MNIIILLILIHFINAYKFKNSRVNKNSNISKHIDYNYEYDYEIPKWVYKKVFKYNKPYKLKESDYFHGLREKTTVNKIDTNYKKK